MSLNDVYEILLILSVLIHLYLNNLILGGFPIMVVTIWLGGRKGSIHLKELGQKMRRVGPRIMMLAIVFGFLVGLVVFGKYGKDLFPIRDALWGGYGLLTLLFIFAFGGILFYAVKDAFITQNHRIHILLSGGIVVSLLGVTLLFVISHILMVQPESSEWVIKNGLFTALSLPTVWPRFFHIVLGSVAATGMVIALYGTLRPSTLPITRYGVGWTLAGTLPQIVVGPWLLVALPEEVRMRLVDGTSFSSLVFFVSLTFALFAIVLLNASLMVPHVRGLVWSGLGSLFFTIVFMVMVREEVRRAWMQSQAGVSTSQELSLAVVLGVTITIVLGCLLFRLSTTNRWLKNSTLQYF